MADSRQKFFYELNPEELPRSVIVLDVDGTLVYDGGTEMDQRTLAVLKKMAGANRVYLCSNKKLHERDDLLAAQVGAACLRSPYKKPNPRVLSSLGVTQEKIVVIGDKFLTDGLLALFAKTVFVKTRHVRHSQEDWKTAAVYWLDDLVFSIFGRFILK